ncbi:MAG: hypothetical protein J0H96_01295 [Microbacterium ginsengisoli]|nr:hypothetical protein [Microbacterium ginsengisoli]
MARSPIEIAISSETGAFEKGIKSGLIKPIEDADKKLEELGRNNGPEQLERAIEQAQRETKDLASETRRTADTIDREFKDAYRNAKRSADDGLDGMSEKSREVGDELRANLGETFSSFRGDLEDLPQIAQDTLGGLAGSGALGGIPGLVATAAGAAGLGLLAATFQNINAEQEAAKQLSIEWANAYIESGGRVLSFDQQMSKAKDILNNQYDELKKNAELWGVSEQTALAAMTGSGAAIDAVNERLEAHKLAAESAAAAIRENGDSTGQATKELGDLIKTYQDGKSAIDKQNTAMETGARIADVYSFYLADLAKNTAGAKTVVDEFGDSVTTLPDGKQIYIDVETGKATDNLDDITNKVYKLPVDPTVRVNVDTTDIGQAEAALKRLQDRARQGISVLVTPKTGMAIY